MTMKDVERHLHEVADLLLHQGELLNKLTDQVLALADSVHDIKEHMNSATSFPDPN